MRHHRLVFWSICTVGLTLFVLSRTVWGPRPAMAAELPVPPAEVVESCEAEVESEAAQRHRTGAARHWRHLMVKR